MEKNNLILVTGATGQQGGAVAEELLSKGYSVRAMTRKPDGEPAKRLKEKGAVVVFGDLDDEDSLGEPLDGVWGALAVQNTWEAGVEREEEQGKRFAKLAKDAGVYHLVYQSLVLRILIPAFLILRINGEWKKPSGVSVSPPIQSFDRSFLWTIF